MAISSDEHVEIVSNGAQENINNLNSSRVEKVNKFILDSFYELTDVNKKTRFQAVENMLNSLQRSKEDDTSDISYCLQRLIRGLASSRKAARQGFAVMLTELLRKFPSVSLDEILSLISKHLSITGDKTEKRNNIIGQIIAFAVIVRSGKVKENLEKINEVITCLQDLQKKNYLKLIVNKLLVNIFNQVDIDCFKQYIWPHLQDDLKIGWEDCTPDILWLLFTCMQLFPEILNSKFLKKHWKTSNILDEENFTHLMRIIKDSTLVHPTIHPVCNVIIENALKLSNFTEFWKLIDETLFVPGQHVKIYLGFQLIKIILPQLKKVSLVKSVLSANFCNMFIRLSVNQHSSLNIAASEMCDFFVKYVSECDKAKLQLEVLMIFIKQPGTIVFDKLTKTKTVSNIIQHLKSVAVKSFAEILKSIFLNNNNENGEVYNDHTRGFAVNQISLLVGHPALMSNISWKKECVQFLLLHSFFKIKQPCDEVPESSQIPTEISDNIREVCLKSFIRSLEFLFRSSSSKKSNLQKKCEMMSSILHYTNTILNLPDYFIPLIDINQIKEYWEDVIIITNKLQKQQKKDGKLHESCAFQTLFVYLGLQLFIDPSETIDILQELKECCNHALMNRRRSNKLDSSKVDESNNEPSWIEVIIELMLSLLSQSSHLTRSIVMAVFPLFCPFITENALKQILNVINPKTNSDENNPLTKAEDDVEELSFESGSDEEMDDDDETEVNNDLRSRLQVALGNEVNDDSEHYLSDSEMFKLDDAIAQAFAQQKKLDKKTTILEETERVHFRMRCLDLIPLFLKSEPPLELIFSVILPLIDAMEYGYRHEKQDNFAKKIETLFSLLIKYKKNANNINQSQFSEMLQKLMDKAKKATDLQIQRKLSQLCIYVVMCSKKTESNQEISSEQSISKDWFIEDYKKLLKHFLEIRATHIQPEIFTSMLNTCPETVWDFAGDLSVAAFSSDFRLYKRTQILEMLLAAIRCMKNLPVLKKKVWKKFFIKLIPNVIKALQDIINSQEIKPTYTIEVLDIIVTVEETNKKFGMSISKDCQDIPELKNLSPKQRQKLQNRGRRLWKRVAQLLSIELS